MYDFRIRTAEPQDLDAVVQVELACFPAAEAADRERLKERLELFGESFLVAETKDGIIGLVNGAVTDHRTIEDEMFEDSSLHDPKGAYQSIFGLDVVKEYRCQGVAAALMEAMIKRAKEQGRKGLILTCKEHMIPFYESHGLKKLGVADSCHGGATWYDMQIWF